MERPLRLHLLSSTVRVQPIRRFGSRPSLASALRGAPCRCEYSRQAGGHPGNPAETDLTSQPLSMAAFKARFMSRSLNVHGLRGILTPSHSGPRPPGEARIPDRVRGPN